MNTWKKSLPIRNLHLGLALALTLGTLCITTPSAAREVPFPTEHTVDAAFDGAFGAHAADLDGDGDLDVLAAANVADDIAWWENTAGDGSTWTEHTVDGSFDGARSVYAADVDGDGDLDVLGAAITAHDIAWFENTAGDGSAWTEHTVDETFNGAIHVYAADIDGDGDLDILGAAYNANDIAWWENTAGDGSHWIDHTVDPAFNGVYDVYAADVDGDGDLDILGAARNADDIAWWENTAGDGTAWTEHTVDGSFDGALDVHASDVDGDGDMDILGAANVADDVAWWENTAGDGTAWTERTADGNFNGANSVHAADVDGDGDLDVMSSTNVDDDVVWWENKTIHRSAYFPAVGEVTVEANFQGALGAFAADVDGDGDLDVLGADWGGLTIAWWENVDLTSPGTGDGSTWIEHTVYGTFDGPFSVYAADVDGDGDIDILGASNVFTEVAWFENVDLTGPGTGDGSTWTKHTVDGTFTTTAGGLYAADVDGDGDMDILGAARAVDDIAWWENVDLTGPGTGDGSAWTKHTVDAAFDGAISVYAADVDGDGDLDVLGAAYDADDIAWWENVDLTGPGTGDGSAWTERTVDAAFDGAYSVYAADVDGDGDLDVLGAADDADNIAWWENTAGDGSTWTEHTVDAAFDGANSVYAADLDGDGDLDVLGAAYDADDIAWWENVDLAGPGTGDGSAWTEYTVDGAFDGAHDVYAADVDGDGDLDVLGAAAIAEDIAWWENRGGQFALATSDTAPAYMNTGAMDDILEIEVIHRGSSGDGDLELVTLELLFEGCYGSGCTPANLTSAQANELFDSLRVYKDTGSGVFESGADTLVANVTSLALTSGVQTVTFSDGDPNVQVAHPTPQTYFVVVDRVDSAPGTPTVDRFTITHITEASSTAEDRSHDIGLALEYVANATSSQVVAVELLPVNSSNDPGDGTCNASECTLREAVAVAASGDTVTFDPALAGVTITLGSEITLDKNLTIDGSGLSSHVQVSGGGSVRVFAIPEGVTIAIDHLDIRNGYDPMSGGGIEVFSSTLTISNTTFSGNSANDGGAINTNHATLFVTDSSFVNNTAAVYGGAINNHRGWVSISGSTIADNTCPTGGGIFNANGYVALINSTVSGNSSTSAAGGLLNYGDPGDGGVMKIKSSTISGNSAPTDAGGGIINGADSTLHLWNTIVANSPSGGDCINAGTIATNINNMIEDGSCSPAVTGDPLLGPLADNDGPTLTMALEDGSPAIDAGDDATCEAVDQRGISRPQGAHCDIGAYEAEFYSVYMPLVVR